MIDARSEAAIQAERWAHADPAHFEWQTALPYCSTQEAALLEGVAAPGGRLLEVGCGEGGNLYHLRDRARSLYGVDFFPRRVAFARARATGASFMAADGARLPFRDHSFEAVLIRDVLHHVPCREAVLGEAWRVLRPRGALFVIEPNTRNPLVLAQATLLRAERGVLASTPALLRRELEALPGRGEVSLRMAQPMPLERVVLNPGFGAPALAGSPVIGGALGLVQRLARRGVPSALWAYMRASTTKLA